MRAFNIDTNNWICGVSDGLSLPCAICNQKVYFDYNVTDELWKNVVPKKISRDVVCLPCFDKMANEKKIDIGGGFNFVQFTGTNITIEFIPCNVFRYKK